MLSVGLLFVCLLVVSVRHFAPAQKYYSPGSDRRTSGRPSWPTGAFTLGLAWPGLGWPGLASTWLNSIYLVHLNRLWLR